MKDYKVDIAVRNNYLWKKMEEKGIKSVLELSKLSGVSYPCVSEIYNLKAGLLNKRTNQERKPLIKLGEFFNCKPNELFPPQHIDYALDNNKTSQEMDMVELVSFENQIGASTNQNLLEDFYKGEKKEYISEKLGELRDREQTVIRHRFCIGEDFKTLKELGEMFNVTQEVIRQVECKALRKLRKPLQRINK
jgi:hypothetical protein